MGDMTKVCPYCGQILGAEETVCKKCGQIYAEPQQQAYTTNNNQNAQYNTANNQQVYTTNTQNQQAYITNNSHTVTEAPMAQAPVTVAVPPQKPKKKSGLIIGIIVAVLVIAAGVFAAVKFDLIGKVLNKKPTDQNAENSAGGTVEYKTGDGKTIMLDDNTYLLEMYPDTKCDADELESMKETIENRVKILGDKYTIESDKDKITLTIDQEMLGATQAERAHNLKIIESNGNQAVMLSGIYTSVWSFVDSNFKELKVETFSRDDFVKEHKDNFSELNISAFEEIESEDIYVIKAKVDSELEEIIDKVANDSIADEEVPVIATDIVNKNVEEMLSDRKIVDIIPVSEGEYDEVYVVSPQAQSKKNAELIVELLDNDGFEHSLDTRLIAEPEWETDSLVFEGKQQASIDGDAVTFEYTPSAYTMSYMSEEEYKSYIKSIKERLKALDVPYALGYAGIEQKTIVVKISPEKMSSDFGRFIFGDDSTSLYSQFKELTTSVKETEAIEDYNGKPAIKVTFYTDKAELYESYSLSRSEALDLMLDDEENGEVVDDGSPKPVYLVINDVNVASADLSEMTDKNEIYFTDFLFAGDEEVTADDMNVLNMFAAKISSSIYLASDSSDDFKITIRHYNGKKEIDDEIKWGYDARNDYDKETIKKVKKLGHKMTFAPEKRNTAVIEIDVPIDEDLSKNFCEAIKEVYNECNFGDGSFAGVIFKIKGEQDKSIADKCRLEFGKDAYDKVGLTYTYDVSGSTFNEYWLEINRLLEEDEFFADKSRF